MLIAVEEGVGVVRAGRRGLALWWGAAWPKPAGAILGQGGRGRLWQAQILTSCGMTSCESRGGWWHSDLKQWSSDLTPTVWTRHHIAFVIRSNGQCTHAVAPLHFY